MTAEAFLGKSECPEHSPGSDVNMGADLGANVNSSIGTLGWNQKLRNRFREWKLANVFSLILALVLFLPVVQILIFGISVWPEWFALQIIARMATTTAWLMVGSSLLATVIATPLAWLVACHEFPLRRLLSVLLVLPLGIPIYVGGYIYADLLDQSGPFQKVLVSLFGVSRAADLHLPEIRSLSGAILIYGCLFFPYVFLFARQAFRTQAARAIEVARTLGLSETRVFFRVGIPMARPALVAGSALVAIEVMNDYGLASYFALETVTTGVFSLWAGMQKPEAASLLSIVAMGLAALWLYAERAQRGQRGYQGTGILARRRLGFKAGWLAVCVCFGVVGWSLILPIAGLMSPIVLGAPFFSDLLFEAFTSSLLLAGGATILILVVAFLFRGQERLGVLKILAQLFALARLGYALPGAVAGLGVLLLVTRLDHGLAGLWEWVTGQSPQILLIGSVIGLVFAWTTRFLGPADLALSAGLDRIPRRLDDAARLGGQRSLGLMLRVWVPNLEAAFGSGFAIVFIDCLHELPAAVLLQPAGLRTLAAFVHERASNENLAATAPGALVMVALGVFASFWLERSARRV